VTRSDYPELVLDIACSGGTYVRSLGRDLAESLGTCAVMSGLVRTAIGPWQVSDAVDPRSLTSHEWRGRLEPLRKAVAGLSVRELADADIARLRKGLSIAGDSDGEDEIAAIDSQGRLIAILNRRGPRQWGPAKNFD
jgi:tRNA pseudouridine55 synthase